MESVITAVLDGDWAGLKKHVEDKTASMIKAKIDDKKIDILASINNIGRPEMEEIINLKNDED